MLKRLFAASLGVAVISSSVAFASEVPEHAAVSVNAAAAAGQAPASAPGVSALNYARGAAVADAVTTHIALTAGAVEANPLVTPSPAGLLAMTAVKFGILEWANTLQPENRAFALKATTATWGGLAASNLLVAASAPAGVSVLAGAGAAYWLWGATAARLKHEAATPQK